MANVALTANLICMEFTRIVVSCFDAWRFTVDDGRVSCYVQELEQFGARFGDTVNLRRWTKPTIDDWFNFDPLRAITEEVDPVLLDKRLSVMPQFSNGDLLLSLGRFSSKVLAPWAHGFANEISNIWVRNSTLVSAPLPLKLNSGPEARTLDPKYGLSIRFVRALDITTNTWFNQFDALFGVLAQPIELCIFDLERIDMLLKNRKRLERRLLKLAA